MWVTCPNCNGTGKVGYGVMEPKFQCITCGGLGNYEDGTIPPPRFPVKEKETGGGSTPNETFSAIFGWVVAGYLFWEMYSSGAIDNDWYFVAPIAAGCFATWFLRRADGLCTLLRRIVSTVLVLGLLAAAYFIYNS